MSRVFCVFVLCWVTYGEVSLAAVQCEYEMTSEHAVYGENIKLISNSTVSACQQECDMTKKCKSVDFYRERKTCYLNKRASPVSPLDTMDYYRKMNCEEIQVTTTAEPEVSIPCEYEITAGHALYGENIQVLRDTTLSDCKEQCDMLESCLSLDFNSYTSSCFLSDHNRESSPDMFGKHHQMDYYEKTGCDVTTTDETEIDIDGSSEEEEEGEDGCPVGYRPWIGLTRSCYRFEIKNGLSWQSARQQCQAEGADLTSVNSQLEMDYLVQTIKDVLSAEGLSHDHELWWVGAKKTSGHQYMWTETQWMDGTVLYRNDPLWYPGEPNNNDETGVCILIMDDIAGLNDLHDDESLRYICEYKDYAGGGTSDGDYSGSGDDNSGSGSGGGGGGYQYVNGHWIYVP